MTNVTLSVESLFLILMLSNFHFVLLICLSLVCPNVNSSCSLLRIVEIGAYSFQKNRT